MIDLSRLEAHEFESLCFDLLEHKGFKNLVWRRGQNEGCSSSDSGRDIQGDLFRLDIDGQIVHETWFVECKHWQSAVSPTAISGLLTWASAERPNVTLVMSSGALSNPAHDWIHTYKTNNNPPFQIKIWEQKLLSALLAEHPDILLQFGIATRATSPHLLALWRDLKSHSLDHLFVVLDSIPEDAREKMLSNAYPAVLPYRIREPITGDEALADLLVDPPDYQKFKDRCAQLVNEHEVSPDFLAHALVSLASRWLAFFADPIDAEKGNERCQRDMARIEEEIARVEAGEDFTPVIKGASRERHLETLRGCVANFRSQLACSADRLADSKELVDQWERDVIELFLNEDQVSLLRSAMEAFPKDLQGAI